MCGQGGTLKEDYKIAAAILIGGQSKRMGKPKESVVIPGDGRTFLEKLCDEVDQVYPDIISGRYVSIRSDQFVLRDGYTPVEDRFEMKGPIGGIASLLMQAKEDGYDAVLALACDLIRYDHTEIENICSRYRGEDVLFCRTYSQGLQPLASIYGTGTLSILLEQIEKGDHRLRDIAGIVKNTGYYDASNEKMYENCNNSRKLY